MMSGLLALSTGDHLLLSARDVLRRKQRRWLRCQILHRVDKWTRYRPHQAAGSRGCPLGGPALADKPEHELFSRVDERSGVALESSMRSGSSSGAWCLVLGACAMIIIPPSVHLRPAFPQLGRVHTKYPYDEMVLSAQNTPAACRNVP